MAVQDARLTDAMSTATHEGVGLLIELIEKAGLDIPSEIEAMAKAAVWSALEALLALLGVNTGRVNVTAEDLQINLFGEAPEGPDELDELIERLTSGD